MTRRAITATLVSAAALLLSCGGSVVGLGRLDGGTGGAGGSGVGGTSGSGIGGASGNTGGGTAGTSGMGATGGTAPSGGTGGTAPSGGTGGTAASGGTGAVEGTGGIGGNSGTGNATVCNGVTCAKGQDCCLVTGKCVNPTSGTCPTPTTPGPQGEKPCGASYQCAKGEYCSPSNRDLCLGAGYCTSSTNCPSTSFQVCGCNGVTYAGLGAACMHGEPTAMFGSASGPCGKPTVLSGGSSSGLTVTYCGKNSQCPTGQQCCGITGLCYDPSLPALCTQPPPGTLRPCIDDSQCIPGVEYCYADGCNGPGGCVLIPDSSTCTGQLDPVCGCDGKDYVNASCAATAGVRVAHTGKCP